jgi:hypothetical protein
MYLVENLRQAHHTNSIETWTGGDVTLKQVLKSYGEGKDWILLAQVWPNGRLLGHCNKPSDSWRSGEFLDKPSQARRLLGNEPSKLNSRVNPRIKIIQIYVQCGRISCIIQDKFSHSSLNTQLILADFWGIHIISNFINTFYIALVKKLEYIKL